VTVLSSRAHLTALAHLQLDPPDLSELITKSGVKVLITIDRTVDPAELSIVQEAVWPYPAELLIHKAADVPLTLYDLIKVIDRLGYPVDYEELQ
jgi:hypothetical protein